MSKTNYVVAGALVAVASIVIGLGLHFYAQAPGEPEVAPAGSDEEGKPVDQPTAEDVSEGE